MTTHQLKWFEQFLLAICEGSRKQKRTWEFHHGDCIGADSDAHAVVASLQDEVTVHIHPPINPIKRAFCVGTIEHPAKEYLDRNRDIVDTCRCIFATPKEHEEQWQGSGTWATIRYAKKTKTRLYIIYPDGEVTKFN